MTAWPKLIDVMDFRRPNYSSTPYVPRHLFNQAVPWQFEDNLGSLQERHQADFADFAAFCLHLPYQLALKGLNKIIPRFESRGERLLSNFEASIFCAKSEISIQAHFILASFSLWTVTRL